MADKASDKKIDEALELLNEMAREKRSELRGMVSEKYGHLKAALGGAGEDAEGQAREAFERGEEKLTEFTSRIDENVHKNPWPYLGGTALGFLILGLLLGRPKK
jgi:ElaB/YqjD/DUF883 family membrane-anchored ribosome-binding protein